MTSLGRTAEAVAAFRHLIRIDPADRYGAKSVLMSVLVFDDQFDEAAELEATIVPGSLTSPKHQYDSALIVFRQYGDTVFARRRLAAGFIALPEVAYGINPAITLPPGHSKRELQARLDDLFLGTRSKDVMKSVRGVWDRVPGSRDWLLRVWNQGPSAEFDAGYFADGTELAISPSPQVDFRTCPHCAAPTRGSHRNLVSIVEPNEIIAHKIKGRYCDDCDVFIALEEEMVQSVAKRLKERQAYRDFMPIGMIDDAAFKDRPPGEIDESWLMEHRIPIRGIDAYAQAERTWFLADTVNEIGKLLQDLGYPGTVDDLLDEMSKR